MKRELISSLRSIGILATAAVVLGLTFAPNALASHNLSVRDLLGHPIATYMGSTPTLNAPLSGNPNLWVEVTVPHWDWPATTYINTAVYHDPVASYDWTTHTLIFDDNTGSISPGQTGTFTASPWDSSLINCGRVQYDAYFSDSYAVADMDRIFSGVIINYGRNCSTGPYGTVRVNNLTGQNVRVFLQNFVRYPSYPEQTVGPGVTDFPNIIVGSYQLEKLSTGVCGTISSSGPNSISEAGYYKLTQGAVLTFTITGCATPGQCGTANAKTYPYSSTSFGSDTICSSTGGSSPSSPAFPAQGSSTSWTCLGTNGGANASCSASRGVQPNTLPTGNFERAECSAPSSTTGMGGWAWDADNMSAAVRVVFYDGPYGSGRYLTETTANGYRPDVGSHAFLFEWPANLKDGTTRSIYAYAIDAQTGEPALLPGSPKSMYCPAPVSPSCGAAATSYPYNATSFSGALCSPSAGTSPSSPSFPSQGGSSSWTCLGAYGGSNSSTCTATRANAPVNGQCGTAAKTYPYSSNSFGSDSICTSGPASPSSPSFPSPNSSSSWTCAGSYGGSTASCTASRGSIPTYNLSVNSSGASRVSISSPTGHSGTTNYNVNNIALNTPVSLVAPTVSSYDFVRWDGCDSQSGGTCSLTVNENETVTAVYSAIPSYVLTVTKGGTGSGSVSSSPAGISCGSDCSESYQRNTSVTLTASPGSGSSVSWSGCDSSSGNTCTVAMNQARSVTTTFTLITYSLSTSISSGTGTITASGVSCPGDCSESYNTGTWVTLIATPGNTYSFNGWTGACAGQTSICSLEMTANRTTSVRFLGDNDSGEGGGEFNYSLSNSGTTSVTKVSGANAYGQNTVTKTLISGTTRPVTLSLSGVPSGVSASISSNPCNPTCSPSPTVTFTVPPTAPVGDYTITVTGAPLFKTTSFTLRIIGAPITVTCSATPGSVLVNQTVTWDGAISGGVLPLTYSWSGTNIPTSPAPSTKIYSRSYSTVGAKSAVLIVTDSENVSAACAPATVQVNFDPDFEEF